MADKFKRKHELCLLFFMVLFTLSYAAKIEYETVALQPGQKKQLSPTYPGAQELVIICYPGEEKLLSAVWRTVTLSLATSSDDFNVYVGRNASDVVEQYEAHLSAWFNLLSWSTKDVTVSPFDASCVGVLTSEPFKAQLQVRHVDFRKLLMAVSGVILFLASPKLSKNSFFYYTSGVSIGILASFLIGVFVVSRFIPKKYGAYAIILGGWTVAIFILRSIWENVQTIAMKYQTYVIGYAAVTGFVSFVVCYRYGPVTNHRTINLMKWTLQLVGLLLVLFSSAFIEATAGIDLLLLALYNFPPKWTAKAKTFWRRRFPPKHTFLSEEEYHEQGVVETTSGLKDLRGYCSSPDCDAWRVVSRLKNPVRFAKFMQGESHISDDEVLAYESEPTCGPTSGEDLLTDDTSEEDDYT